MPVNQAGRAGSACLAAALVFYALGGYAETLTPADLSPDVFRKPPLELAQLLQAPPEQDTESEAPSSAAPTSAAPAESVTEDESFVFAGDLAVQLRKIDPDARVDWDGKKLRIEANGHEFAVFPTGEEMVVDGDVETETPPLKIRNGEIYVPQEVIARIGQQLETDGQLDDTATTVPAVATPGPDNTPTPTPEAPSILPDTTPAIATPTPVSGEATQIQVLPDVTPAPTAAATPAATAAGPTVAAPQATPFPQATATPTPTPTPAPTPTPQPHMSDAASEAESRNALLSTESFKAALRDKVSVSKQDVTVFSMSQLQEMAAARAVNKIVIHPDESGWEREDQYGREAANTALAISQRLKNELEAAGIEAVLTRETEDGVTIGDSMEIISKSGAQLLLVVSVGYSTTFKDLGGYRIFYMNESVDCNSLEEKTFDASEAVPAELNYKPFQTASKVLASSVKNSINAALDREPVGTNPAPLYLVRRAPMAAAAVVVGYLSNPADAQRLTDESEQDAMAKALAEGILNYANQVSQGKTAESAGGL